MITAEQIKFPVDFEKLAKSPPAANGRGSPFQISGRALMADFNAAALLVDTTEVGGLSLEETREGGRRYVSLAGTVTAGAAMPDGNAGDMLYHNGSEWVLLAAPSAPSAGTVNILKHGGTLPSWENYDEVEVDICIAGTPTAYKLLGNPA